MADAAQAKARKAIRKAQSDFERSQERHEQIREARRKSFEQAQAAGLSTREIAEETGLHFTRVARIIQAKP
jgi:DNA invertase Pin-like site-specific DNA recombinase